MPTVTGNTKSSVAGQFKTSISYSTSETATSYTVTSSYHMTAVTRIDPATGATAFKYHLSGYHSGDDTQAITTKVANATWKIFERSATITKGTSTKSFSVAFAASVASSPAWTTSDSSVASLSLTVPALEHWSVTYNANGGSGAPSTQTKYYSQTLTLSSTKPTRSGYTFKRWVSSGRTDGTVYFQPGNTTNYNGAQSLVAEWTANTSTITYNANGGTQSSSGASNYPIGTTKHVTSYNNTTNLYNVTTFGLTKTGYHVNSGSEWNKKADGTGTSYNQETNYSWSTFGSTSASNTNVTLYANWKPNTFIISYNANGGSQPSSPTYPISTTTQTREYNNSINLYDITTFQLTRTGYHIESGKEWNTKADGTGTSYNQATDYSWSTFGSTSTASKSITLYANWKIDTYTITFDANGGTGAPGTITKTYNVSTYIPSTKPTRTGYTFKRWVSSGRTDVYYAAGERVDYNGNQTLVAEWEQTVYTVSYNTNGGSGTITNQTKTYGQSLTLSSGTSFTRTYYTLTGWNTSANGKGTAYSLSGTYNANESTTLYAQWELDYIKPALYNVSAYRVASSAGTTVVDDGEYIHIEASYIPGYYEEYLESTLTIKVDGTTKLTQTIPAGTSSGSVSQTYGIYATDTIHTVVITLTVTDSSLQSFGGATASVLIPSTVYPIDVYGSGNTVYMGVMHAYVTGQKLTVPDVFIDGDLYLVIDSNASSGTTDGDLYNALDALGWN